MLRHDQALKEGLMKWRRLLSEQSRSGQSVKAFCREHGLCRRIFRMEEAAGGRHVKKFLEVQVAGHGRARPAIRALKSD